MATREDRQREMEQHEQRAGPGGEDVEHALTGRSGAGVQVGQAAAQGFSLLRQRTHTKKDTVRILKLL